MRHAEQIGFTTEPPMPQAHDPNSPTPVHIAPEWGASVIGIQIHRYTLSDCVVLL